MRAGGAAHVSADSPTTPRKQQQRQQLLNQVERIREKYKRSSCALGTADGA